jgi:RNA polymerase sigma-70 factor (ECF subfamily)
MTSSSPGSGPADEAERIAADHRSLAPSLPPDLELAAACVAGDTAAIAALDTALPELVHPVLARVGVAPGDTDEVLQRVRVALLAPGADGAIGLAGYTGRGALKAYIRAVAAKLALKKREREDRASDPIDDLLAGGDDSPELQVIKDRCRGEIRAAVAAAIELLGERERTLLRQHYVDGLSVDVLGRLHRVHRATAARWLTSARADLLRAIRRHFQSALGMDRRELDSAIGLVRSGLDLSLSRLLAPPGRGSI